MRFIHGIVILHLSGECKPVDAASDPGSENKTFADHGSLRKVFCRLVSFAAVELRKISCKAKNNLISLESCSNETAAKVAQQPRRTKAKAETALEQLR